MLKEAYSAWLARHDFRSARLRHFRYAYGDQWSDLVKGTNGDMIVERDSIIESGKRPMTNNLIGRLVRTLIGIYRDHSDQTDFYAGDPDGIFSRNDLRELDCRLFEEFIISGCAVQRIVSERRPEGSGVWIDNVPPDRFFTNDFRDPRGFDIKLAGMLHDMTMPEIINRFSRRSRHRAERLRQIFSHDSHEPIFASFTSAAADFYTAPEGYHRVIEVWSLDARPCRDKCTAAMEFVWRCRWYAPDGTELMAYDSPFAHGSHPFAIRFYPLVDGHIHSFVEDLIDQQRNINRTVVLIDTMMASAAKGALLFPTDQLPPSMTIEDIGRLWSAPNAVIPIAGKSSNMPQQMISNTADSGAFQLLGLHQNMMQDIAGMGDAILGRNISPSTGSALYEAQLRHGSLTMKDLLESFMAFLTARNKKIL